jgi:hypothetical protein
MAHKRHVFTAIVDPVFQMVPVPALMVQPGRGVAKHLPLGSVWASGAGVVFRTDSKFRPRILAQIVQQPLPNEPHAKTVAHDQKFVVGYGLKVPKHMHIVSSLGDFP